MSSRFGLRKGSSSFRCLICVYIVLEAARISTRTLAFPSPWMTNSMFSNLDRFLCIAFGIFFWVSFPGCCPLKRPVFITGIQMIVPHFLLDMAADHFFQSRITGRFSFLDCILQIQTHERPKFPGEMELLLEQVFLYIFIGYFCHGQKCSVPLGVEALHVVILQMYYYEIVEVKKSFACSTDLEVVTDHVGNFSSFQESIVLFCLLTRLLKTAVNNFLRARKHSSQYRTRRL